MNAQDTGGHWLLRVGGLAALTLALAYLLTIPLYAYAGTPPTGGEAWLGYLQGKAAIWWAILALSVLTDFLFVPVALALYHALRGVNRNLALLGTAFIGLFAVLDLAVTWPNYAALITLSRYYATALNEAQRASYVAAANYAAAALPYSLAVYSILVPSMGILLTSLVMRRGVFSRTTAYVGIVTGGLGVVSVVGPFFVAALGITIILTSVLTIVWLVLAGYRLYRTPLC